MIFRYFIITAKGSCHTMAVYKSNLPPKIVLQTNNILFVRRIFRIHMLPNFGDNSPWIKTNQPMEFSFIHLDKSSRRKLLHLAFFVCIANFYTNNTCKHFPYFGSAKMILPRQSLVWGQPPKSWDLICWWFESATFQVAEKIWRQKQRPDFHQLQKNLTKDVFHPVLWRWNFLFLMLRRFVRKPLFFEII